MSRFGIVTGANQGIGLEIAKKLFLDMNQVVLACRSVERANEAVNTILNQEAAAGLTLLKPLVIPLDLSDPSTFAPFAAEIQKLGRPVDFLINNAAILDSPGLTVEKATDVVTVNYTNTALFCEAMLPIMSQGEKDKSRIVLMGSRLGCTDVIPHKEFGAAIGDLEQLTSKGVLDRQMDLYLKAVAAGDKSWNNGYAPAYCVSKALAMAWFRLQAAKTKGVTWYNCCPGFVATNMTNYSSHARTPAKAAADTPVWLAVGAKDEEIVNGGFYAERKVLDYAKNVLS